MIWFKFAAWFVNNPWEALGNINMDGRSYGGDCDSLLQPSTGAQQREHEASDVTPGNRLWSGESIGIRDKVPFMSHNLFVWGNNYKIMKKTPSSFHGKWIL